MLEVRAPRLVLFSADDEWLGHRVRRRRRLTAMRPVDATDPVVGPDGPCPDLPADPCGGTGYHWELLRGDDEPVAIRARGFDTADAARRDAPRVLARVSELRPVYVRDVGAGHLGWWLALDDEPVLVAPRVWSATQRAAVVRDAGRALHAMTVTPAWGRYEHAGAAGPARG